MLLWDLPFLAPALCAACQAGTASPLWEEVHETAPKRGGYTSLEDAGRAFCPQQSRGEAAGTGAASPVLGTDHHRQTAAQTNGKRAQRSQENPSLRGPRVCCPLHTPSPACSCPQHPCTSFPAKPCPLLPATSEHRAAQEGSAISSYQEMLSDRAFAVLLLSLKAMPSPLDQAARAEAGPAGPSSDSLPTLSRQKVCGAVLSLKELGEV